MKLSVYLHFFIWFLFHTVAIASLGFFRSESFRVLVFNKKGIDNAQLARVGLDWEGFGWTRSYVSSTQWPNYDMRNALLPQVLKMEDSFREYEKIASPMNEELKCAVLMKCLGGQLKTFLQVTMKETTSYEELREAALRFDQSTIRWTHSMSLGASVSNAADTAVPMDVDRVEKGKGKKGKSKDAGKGKDKGKGKQKGKSFGEKGYNSSGKGYGFQQNNSWGNQQNSVQNSGWSGKSDSSSKGSKSGKGQKGKDTGKNNQTCHRCGKFGHYAKDCRVRLVGHDDSNNNQTETKPDKPVISNNSGNVKRVLFEPEPCTTFRQLDFDLTGMSGDGNCNFSVNMVSTDVCRNSESTDVFRGDFPDVCSDSCNSAATDNVQNGCKISATGRVQEGCKISATDRIQNGCMSSATGRVQDSCNSAATDNVQEGCKISATGRVADSCNAPEVCSAGFREFSLCKTDACACSDVYNLHELFQLDDFEHYVRCVANSYRFDLYDVMHCDSMKFSCKQVHNSDFIPCELKERARADKCRTFDGFHVCRASEDVHSCKASQECHVRVVATTSHSDIVLDSGSDVTLLPFSMSGLGTPSATCSETFLRDAQGKQITTTDVRDVTFVFQSTDGQMVRVKERAFFSEKVDVPLLSFGKLIKSGWGILSTGSNSPPVLSHSSGACVELGFRNNSLVVEGDIRMVQDVRAVSVDIPRTWQNLKAGWYTVGDFPVCSSGAQRFVDVTSDYLVVDWPYRTTLAYHDIRGWEVIELCERLFPMSDRAAPIVEGGYRRLLTLLSKSVLSIADFGMVISEPVVSERSSGSAAMQQSAQRPQPEAQEAVAEEMEDIEVAVEIPQTIAIAPRPDNVKIAGVDVSCTSAISVLKAACSYLQVSQSGSKSKLWERILATLDKRAIEAERELAAVAIDESQRKADSIHVAEPPTDPAVVASHNLTHMPYQPWCPACVMSKGRPDQHRTDPSSLQRRELPIISWDLCFSGKTCEAVSEDDAQAKLSSLVVHDSHTGAVQCIPIQSKKQTKYMSAEILRFINFLGYGDVMLRCDQEPTTLQVQKYVQRARQQSNLRTVVENSKLLDHGGNSAVEKAIDRIRLQASVFLHQLSQKIGFEIPPQHPLFAWAFVHSSWILTRFGVIAGQTPYELIAGHAYNAKLCEFGCPIMVYVGDSVKQKTDAKWRTGIFLGKVLTNDMDLTSVAGTLKLTRSIKAIFPKWEDHMEDYRQVLVFPWQLEGTIGNRIVPTLRGSTATGGIAVPPLDDEMGEEPLDDVEEETVPPTPIPDFVPLQPAVGMRPPPASAVVSDPDGARPVESVAATPNVELHAQVPEATEEAGHPAPSLGLPGPATPLEMLRPAVETVGMEVEDTTEPSAKRQKLSVMRVGDEELFHMDVDNDEYLADAQFSEFAMEATVDVEMSDLQEPQQNEMSEDDLW